MSSRINLNDNTSDRFEFTIGGLDYDFKYPTMEDVEPITNLYNEREIKVKDETAEGKAQLAEIDKKIEDALYALVMPVGHTTPIREVLKKQPLPVVHAFNKMMNEQLTAE